ncbi:hypothetical protein AKO1_006322 [Acrasis kona]|uniref:General stress protein FMN-binding split barrel domain-containing protein n=1 Tax=Acrasis kona TaxID=1008807 RepID=A0AAW2YHS3_9EUKA
MSNPEQHAPTQENLDKIKGLIHGIQMAMLTTQSEDGKDLHSRPMYTQSVEFDGKELWFFTRESSTKVHEIQTEKHVNVAYSDGSHNTFVSVSGRATLVKDQKKNEELWNPLLKAWFPKGVEDPELSLIKVAVDGVEYWDQPNSKMVQLYSYVKAKVTGETYQPTEDQNKKVDVSGKQ